MFFRLLLLFTLVPLLELYLLIRLGTVIGGGATVLLVIATGVLGAWLARTEGLRVLHRIRAETDAGRLPAAALVDGLLIFVAGAVLLTPGLLTDVLGFVLLTPVGRRGVRRLLRDWWRRRLERGRTEVIVVDRRD